MILQVLDVRQEGGIIVASSSGYHSQVWVRVFVRQYQHCEVCGVKFRPRTQMYRPMTNMGNRMWRVCLECVDWSIKRSQEAGAL